MGWSFRKSISAGPLRVNFSKSGVSYSLGVKGARVNFGPRGTYVNLGAHGISYRQKISGGPSPAPPALPRTVPALPRTVPALPYPEVYEIASAEVEQLTDTDSKAFIEELTKKAQQLSYVKWFGVLPLIAFIAIMAFTSFGARKVITQPATDSTLVKVTHYAGVNVRSGSSARSKILKAAVYGETFPLLDSTDAKWLKVEMRNGVGYIKKHFALISHVHHELLEMDEPYLANPYAIYELLAGTAFFVFWIRYLKKADKRRFEMSLHYEMDDQFKEIYRIFSDHFKTFTGSARIWQYVNARPTNDYKRTGGAGKLINRLIIRDISLNKAPIAYFSANVAIPYLQLNHLELYFLPERLLIKRNKSFAAVFYKNLRIDGFTTRFIEDESVPYDAQIVDQTWRFVNKQGGPDRRFNNNRQIPICAYSEYTITSDSGVYEVLTTSRKGAMDGFAGFLEQIGNLQRKMVVH